MHWAAISGNIEVATLLINNGTNLNAVDEVSIKYLLYYILVMCLLQCQCKFHIIITSTSAVINYNYYSTITIIIITCRNVKTIS